MKSKAFTIVELLVAMTLVIILVALSSVIFSTGVKAHRTADSTVEIVRRTESVSRQLAEDVAGLQTDAPIAVWFERVPVDTTGDGVMDSIRRHDQILFFAKGDFQTMGRYNNQTVRGNLARIYYGHAWKVTIDENNLLPLDVIDDFSQSRLLSRRTHLLTSDMSLPPMGPPNNIRFPNPNEFSPIQFNAHANGQFVPYWNNRQEYDQLSLAEWKNLMHLPANCNQVLRTCFYNADESTILIGGRPMIDTTEFRTLHLLLSEHISEFKVQWAYKSEDLVRNLVTGETFQPNEAFPGVAWWPDIGDFGMPGGGSVGENSFGVFFNMPAIAPGQATPPWTGWYHISTRQNVARPFRPSFVPRAIKFTFTVHDDKGLFPEGRTFTQIVYINQ